MRLEKEKEKGRGDTAAEEGDYSGEKIWKGTEGRGESTIYLLSNEKRKGKRRGDGRPSRHGIN